MYKLSTYIIYTEYSRSVVRVDAWGELVFDLITNHIWANLSLNLEKLNLASERDYVLVILVYLYASGGIRFKNPFIYNRKKQTYLIKYIYVFSLSSLNKIQKWDQNILQDFKLLKHDDIVPINTTVSVIQP